MASCGMDKSPTTEDMAAWFAGDKDALDVLLRMVSVAHTWDDLIDQDQDTSDGQINRMVMDLLLYLPGNPFYRRFEGEMRALVMVGMTGYLAANIMEKGTDAHRLELAHYFRYAVIGTATFMLAAIHGIEPGAKLLAEIAPQLIPERLEEFLKERGHV